MKIIDTHVHTTFSFDGENNPREMVEKALESGLHALTFTDHVDANDYYNPHYRNSELIPLAAREIPPLKDEYAGRIRLGFGMEIGQFLHNSALVKQLIGEFKLDYIIGSTHSTKNYDDYYGLDFSDPTINHLDLLREYFEEVLEMVENADIDVIGHLTYPLRRITGKYKIPVDMNVYTENIREIFKAAALRGIGLEINTGGLRNPDYLQAEPGLEYAKMFREAGGEIITIGSDAHRISDLAANFKEGTEIAKAAGFTRIAYYEKRKPIFTEME